MKLQKIIRILALILATQVSAFAKPLMIGYVSVWSFNKGYTVKQIPWNDLTHVIYSSLSVNNQLECSFSSDEKDSAWVQEKLSELKAEKSKHPKTKLLLSIGTLRDAGRFSKASMTRASREHLVSSCIKIYHDYGFDGIDIDWEYPVHAIHAGDGSVKDKKNFPLLLTQFRKQLGTLALLTVATTAYQNHLLDLDVGSIAKQVNWFGVMAYDFCMGASNKTCSHSSFDEGTSKSYGRNAIQYYLDHGAKKEQIVLGVPFYGYLWKVSSTHNFGINQPVIKGPKADDYDGFTKYFEIKKMEGQFSYHWDNATHEPWLIDLTNQKVLNYEDQSSLKYKSEIVRNEGYGGMMIWEIAYDTENHELLKAMLEEKNTDEFH